MTDPDHSALDAAVAAYEQAVAAGDANLTAAAAALQTQLAAETAKEQADQTTIAALTAQVAALQAQLAALQPKVLYGSGIGGWWKAKLETKQQAYGRILQTFGALPIIRDFDPYPPTYIDRASRIFLDAGATLPLATVQQLAAWGAHGEDQFVSVLHEPNNSRNNLSPAEWVPSQQAAASAISASGAANVHLVPTLEGEAFIPSRDPATPAEPYFDVLTAAGVQFGYIGADLYQWGKSDATADSAQTVLDGAITLARQLGKKLIVGELGARRPNPPYTPGISRAARAQFLSDVIALCDANADVVTAVMLFESDNGNAGMVPWPITHPGDPTYSPEAVAVWAAACSR